MTLLMIGAVLGWIVTGTVDYFAARKAAATAFRKGLEEGQAATLRQVAGW